MNDHQDQEITSTVTEDEALNIVLSALLYEDGKRRSYTHATRNLIEKYKEVMGKANYKFIEGILDYGIYREPYALFQHAERMGCRHPMLYHFLAKCCCEEDKGTYVDYMKALNYYQQATSRTLYSLIDWFPLLSLSVASFLLLYSPDCGLVCHMSVCLYISLCSWLYVKLSCYFRCISLWLSKAL